MESPVFLLERNSRDVVYRFEASPRYGRVKKWRLFKRQHT